MVTLEGWRLSYRVKKFLVGFLLLLPVLSLLRDFIPWWPIWSVRLAGMFGMLAMGVLVSPHAAIWEKAPGGGCARGLSEEEKQRLEIGQNKKG